MSGIYKITNLIDDREYVGSAVNFKKRWSLHKSCLMRLNHHSKYLQNFVNKYGYDKLVFEIIELCTVDNLEIREQWYLDNTVRFGYDFNICLTVGTNLGRKFSEEARKNMSNAHKGKTTKKIKQYTLEGIFVKTWDSIIEASLGLNLDKKRIGAVVRGEDKRVGNKLFTFDDGTKNNIAPYNSNFNYPVNLIDNDGNIIKSYTCTKEASKDLKISISSIGRICNGHLESIKNYKFKRAN